MINKSHAYDIKKWTESMSWWNTPNFDQVFSEIH